MSNVEPGEPALPPEFTARALFDNGVARVETHPAYGAIIRGGVRVAIIGGAPAFVPIDPGDEDAIAVPDDPGGLL